MQEFITYIIKIVLFQVRFLFGFLLDRKILFYYF